LHLTTQPKTTKGEKTMTIHDTQRLAALEASHAKLIDVLERLALETERRAGCPRHFIADARAAITTAREIVK
jgi:hypothetical protein